MGIKWKWAIGITIASLMAWACAAGSDPGEAVNHVHVGNFVLDLTFGPLATLISSCIVAPLIIYFIKRYIKQGDDTRLTAIADKEKIDELRHSELKKDIKENRELVLNQLSEFCRNQEKLHAQIDARFWSHYHTDDGDIAISRENGRPRVGGI
jgi:hypothetical protein